jgi:hypothetical protein
VAAVLLFFSWDRGQLVCFRGVDSISSRNIVLAFAFDLVYDYKSHGTRQLLRLENDPC